MPPVARFRAPALGGPEKTAQFILTFDGMVQVEAGAELAGKPVVVAERPGETHVLAVRRRGTDMFDWSLDRDRLLAPQDQLLVLATRAGLGQTLARNRKPAPLTVS